jgi:hypothetical protein
MKNQKMWKQAWMWIGIGLVFAPMVAGASPTDLFGRSTSLAEAIEKRTHIERELRKDSPQVRPANRITEAQRNAALMRVSPNTALLNTASGETHDPALGLRENRHGTQDAEEAPPQGTQCFPVEQTIEKGNHQTETAFLTHNGQGLLKMEEHFIMGSGNAPMSLALTVVHQYNDSGERIATQRRYTRGQGETETALVDTTHLIRNTAGQLTKRVVDRTSDGNPEEITRFFYTAEGLLEQEERDVNADGTIDLVRSFLYGENGALTHVLEDRNNDGSRDMIKELLYTASGDLFRIRIDNGADGEVDALETFTHQNGVLVATLRTALVAGELEYLTLFGHDELGNPILEATDHRLDGSFDQITTTEFECD